MSAEKSQKIIWIMWFQGIANSPEIVKSCVDSWVKHNAEWDVIVLDAKSVMNYIGDEDLHSNIDLSSLSLAHQADIYRLLLLRKYGGVWADATTYCMLPLDSWLGQYTETGFFAFSNPGPDRLISNWFLWSEQSGYQICKLIEDVEEYWVSSRRNRFRYYTIDRILNIYPRIWFSKFVKDKLRKMPYFWFHYLFSERYRKDSDFRELWGRNRKIEAKGPHSAQDYGLDSDANGFQAFLDGHCPPLFKLTWKLKRESLTENSLYWLFEKGKL
jgi:hypothetical protein